VGAKRFDTKFGAELLAGLPTTPGVYLFRDASDEVLYVGKAKNIRRRLTSYRNAGPRKRHRKMRMLVREAASLEVRLQASERAALAVENELIQTLSPRYNVEGTYSFLYPAIGLGRVGGRTLLCFTTTPGAWDAFDLRWYGAFRSRLRAKEAFDALVDLLALLGHVEKRARLGSLPKTPGSRIVGFRQLDHALVASLHELFAGRSAQTLGALALRLLGKPRARRDAQDVQTWLRTVEAFYDSDLAPLATALRAAGAAASYVAQDARDRLFIEHG